MKASFFIIVVFIRLFDFIKRRKQWKIFTDSQRKCSSIDLRRSNKVFLKRSKFINDLLLETFLWLELQLPWPLCGEKREAEKLV